MPIHPLLSTFPRALASIHPAVHLSISCFSTPLHHMHPLLHTLSTDASVNPSNTRIHPLLATPPHRWALTQARAPVDIHGLSGRPVGCVCCFCRLCMLVWRAACFCVRVVGLCGGRHAAVVGCIVAWWAAWWCAVGCTGCALSGVVGCIARFWAILHSCLIGCLAGCTHTARVSLPVCPFGCRSHTAV